MNSKGRIIKLFVFGVMILVVILDSHTAYSAAMNAMELCIKTVIPGVFPLLFLSSAVVYELEKISVPFLERILKIPAGSAGYFLIGLLCGYPVGAKILQDAINSNQINKDTGVRMMAFCNNASPAFIIGVLSSVFHDWKIAIIMWGIQIIASFLVGILLKDANEYASNIKKHDIQVGNTMTESLKAMAVICGWVVMFGVVLAYIKNYTLTDTSPVAKAVVSGLMELTNGIHALAAVRSPAVQWILSAAMLSLGGICVLMQTKSVAPDLDIKAYLTAKFTHACITGFLASCCCLFIYPVDNPCIACIPLFFCAGIMTVLIHYFNKKVIAIGVNM